MATHTASLNRIGKYPTILIEETPGKSPLLSQEKTQGKFPTPFTRKNTREIPHLSAKKILGNTHSLHVKNTREIPHYSDPPNNHNNIVNS